ncbi:hypothetical protein O6H91_19G006600 [Diphasiastrum complanatum]|nr:hypothetical protein O6H91_19G006600 [Diphasiastrum complanatum]
MGSKATGGVAERRLRPLWDAIDGRKYKSALKLASGLLAKHPDSPYLLVLKGLVLERLGKADEALALCQQARDKEPVDDLILSTLQIVYQRLNRLNEATLSYEVACTKCPSNLELMLALFNCYAREYNFVKQQQTAMKMYKAFGEERFLLWAVCNIYLQIQCGLGDGKKLLPLAQALLKKRIASHGLQELEALLLYIAILQDLGMFETASDVLSSQLGGLFSIKIEKEKLKGEVLLRSHQYELAAGVYKEILLSSPDDWESILRFIDASLQVSSVNPSNSFSEGENQDGCSSDVRISPLPYHLSEDQVDERLMLVKTFLKELQVDDMKDLRRGPFLAMVEIENRILLYKLLVGPNLQDGKKNSSKSLAHSLIEYFKRFGHLPCFLPDIKKYLIHLEDSERHWVAEALDASCLLSQSEPPLRLLRRRIAAFHVEDQLGLIATMSERGIFAHAAKMIKLYLDCVEMSSGLDPQESMHGEELLVVASNLFIELFRRSQKLAFLLEALLILEFGLLIRRFNFNYKLILINLYSFLGAVGPAVDWYKTLDVKNILLETVSHHIMPALLGSLHWLDLESLLKEVIKFHEDYQKEAADFSILAYQHCNYSKVLEFVDLKRRLERSHNYTLASIEAAILSLKQKVDNLDEVEALLASMGCGLKLLELSTEEKLSSLHFNEDLQTRPWWSPVPDESFLEG